MSLRPLQPEERKRVERLLDRNPFKEDQLRFQSLDREKLVRFHADKILRQAGGGESAVFIAENDGRTGLIGFHPSPFHSLFFGKSVFSIEPVITYAMTGREKLEFLREVQSRLEKEFSPEIVWFKCDEAEGEWVRLLSLLGGEYCGASIRMSLWLGKRQCPNLSQDIVIREAKATDVASLKEVAGLSHQRSHFFRDPHLPHVRKAELFPHYLEDCLERTRFPCLLAEDGWGKTLGFSLLITPRGQEETIGRRIGIVDFIAVMPEAQGKGVGKSLLTESLSVLERKGFELAELKTMLENRRAIGFYQRYGFRILSSEMHFSFGKE